MMAARSTEHAHHHQSASNVVVSDRQRLISGGGGGRNDEDEDDYGMDVGGDSGYGDGNGGGNGATNSAGGIRNRRRSSTTSSVDCGCLPAGNLLFPTHIGRRQHEHDLAGHLVSPERSIFSHLTRAGFKKLSLDERASTSHCMELGVIGPSKTESNLHGALGAGDKVAMDFGDHHKGRIISDPDEMKQIQKEDFIRARAVMRRPADADRTASPTAYMIEPWFHYGLTREGAEKLFANSGRTTRLCASHRTTSVNESHDDAAPNGSFLVRTSNRIGGFVICLAYNGAVQHYPVAAMASPDGQSFFTVDGGRTKFRDLVQLIDFYQMNVGGVFPMPLGNYITKAIAIPHRRSDSDIDVKSPPMSL